MIRHLVMGVLLISASAITAQTTDTSPRDYSRDIDNLENRLLARINELKEKIASADKMHADLQARVENLAKAEEQLENRFKQLQQLETHVRNSRDHTLENARRIESLRDSLNDIRSQILSNKELITTGSTSNSEEYEKLEVKLQEAVLNINTLQAKLADFDRRLGNLDTSLGSSQGIMNWIVLILAASIVLLILVFGLILSKLNSRYKALCDEVHEQGEHDHSP